LVYRVFGQSREDALMLRIRMTLETENQREEEKKKIPHRPKSVARELIPCRHFEPARVTQLS